MGAGAGSDRGSQIWLEWVNGTILGLQESQPPQAVLQRVEPWAGRKQARSVEGPSRREEGPGAAIMDDVAAAAHGKPRIVI